MPKPIVFAILETVWIADLEAHEIEKSTPGRRRAAAAPANAAPVAEAPAPADAEPAAEAPAAPFDYAKANYDEMTEKELWNLLVLPYTEPKRAKELGYKKLLGEETDPKSAIRVWSDAISRKEGVPAATADEDEDEDGEEDV